MSDTPITAALLASALQLADRAVVSDIEGEGTRVAGQDGLWYDIAAMVSEREHGPEGIDMNSEALAYAYARGLIEPHPHHAHLVRITRLP